MIIDAENFIIGILHETQRFYIDIDEVESIFSHVRSRVIEDNKYQTVVFDVNLDSIERVMQYRHDIFDLIGGRIYLKCDPAKLSSNLDYYLRQLIREYS